jgi:hypothetical protein
MQTPPPFHGYEGQPPAPQKKKTNTVVILFAVLGVLLVCCGLPIGAISYFGFKGFKGGMAIAGCMANVNSMKVAMHEYSKAHDGKLPNAETWQTDIGKYFKVSKDMEGAPFAMWKSGGEWSCEESGIKTGFMFNADLSDQKVSDVIKKNPDAIAIFETKTVAFNQSGPYKLLPYAESPKIMGDFLKERRGWMMIDADSTNVYTLDKKGRRIPFNMNSGKGGDGFNFNMDTNSDDEKKKSSSSDDSKDDNSN